MSRDLRVGVIGCGNVALRAHLPALRRQPGVQVVGVVDPVPARRAQAQALLDLPETCCWGEYHDLLEAGVDYVTLTVPQRFRRPIVEDCARAGVPVLCEKPLATTLADGQAMVDVMRAAGLHFGMVHNYLFFPEYRLARELITAGAIGRLRHVMLNFLGMPDNPGAAEYRPAWRHDPAEAGGGILMDMVHLVYLAEYFFDAPIRWANAVVDNLDHPGDSVEDFTIVNYAFDQGYATLNLWWGGGPGGLEISGTEGRILVFYKNYDTGPFTDLTSFTLVNRDGRQDLLPRTDNWIWDTFVDLHADFGEAVRTGRAPIAPAEAGLRTLAGALAAYASAATCQAVALPFAPGEPVYQRGVLGLAELAVADASPLRQRGILGLAPREGMPT